MVCLPDFWFLRGQVTFIMGYSHHEKRREILCFMRPTPRGFPSKGLPKERIGQQGNAENEWPFGNLLGEPRLSKSNSFAGTKYCQKTFAQRNVKQTKKTYLKTKNLQKKGRKCINFCSFSFNKQKFAQKKGNLAGMFVPRPPLLEALGEPDDNYSLNLSYWTIINAQPLVLKWQCRALIIPGFFVSCINNYLGM